MDSWGGYPAAHARFVKTIADTAPNRTVVITGDNHANWVNEILMHGTTGTQVTTEFLGTSITSGGDGSERSNWFSDAAAAENPHVKWQNNRRGYVVCEVTPDNCRAEYRTVPFVERE
jgi:alkaline phosphatase D